MIEISIVPYKFKYLEEMNAISKLPILGKLLPKVGFVALSGKTVVGYGFVRRLEPCYYIIDELMVTRFLGSMIADVAVRGLVAQLTHGIELNSIVMVIAADKVTMIRAQGLGVFDESVCTIRSREDR